MLSEQAILDAQNINHDPIHRPPDPGDPAVEHDIIAIGPDQRIFVLQLLWRSFYELEQTIAARSDVSAVLKIGGGPETLGRGVIPLVEERVERLQHERFVL